MDVAEHCFGAEDYHTSVVLFAIASKVYGNLGDEWNAVMARDWCMFALLQLKELKQGTIENRSRTYDYYVI